MALDLFFVTPGPSFDQLRSPAFSPRPAQSKARRKVAAALLQAYPGSTLEGDAASGFVQGFPLGQLSFTPGTIHWSLHHVDDTAAIRSVVDWFLEHGLICEDPQGAGFGNRTRPSADDGSLDSLDQLVGAHFLGLRLDRNWATAIALEWTLADERYARLSFMHFSELHLPQLFPLVKARVVAVTLTQESSFDTLQVRFEGEHELRLVKGVLAATTVARRTPALT